MRYAIALDGSVSSYIQKKRIPRPASRSATRLSDLEVMRRTERKSIKTPYEYPNKTKAVHRVATLKGVSTLLIRKPSRGIDRQHKANETQANNIFMYMYKVRQKAKARSFDRSLIVFND